MNINFELSNAQKEFISSKAKDTAFVGGLGSGKSYILWLSFIVNEIIPYPDALHLGMANSYKQLKDASIPTLTSLLEQMNIPYNFKRGDMELIVMDKTRVLLRSMEVAERLRSVEAGSLYVDEGAFARKFDFQTAYGRLRDKRGSLNFRMATTPRGFNWVYDMFVEQGAGRHLIQATSSSNKHLPEEYLKSLESAYDPKLLEQEMGGAFVNLNSSSVYYAFDRNVHLCDIPLPRKGASVYIGMDFNVDPMTACAFIWNGQKEPELAKFAMFKEFYARNSNTMEMSREIAEFCGENGYNALVIPDSTGKNRKTSSSRTDHQIIRDAGLEVAKTSNPRVKDRYNCANGHLHHKRVLIDRKCVNTIKDLEQMAYDNKDPMISHMSDSFSYVLWHLAKTRTKRKSKIIAV